MIDLGSTEFYIKVPSLALRDLETYSSKLFDTWDTYVSNELFLDDYSLLLEIEDGSIKGNGKIAATIGALYAGICAYGSFIQGLETISNHTVIAGKYLSEAAQHLYVGAPEPTIKRKQGAIGRLERLFKKVQLQEMTIDEAMAEAEALIGDEARNEPKLMRDLKQALHEAPSYGVQTYLPFEEDEIQIPQKKQKNPTRRIPDSIETIPRRTQLRVEISRDSKHGKKILKVIER